MNGEVSMGAEKAYLAVCAIYRDEAPDLPEWLELHRLVGVERFFLYDDGSRDAHDEVLAPYIEQGIVTRHEWTVPENADGNAKPGQFTAYDHCLAEHRHDARWVAFLDADEFLFSPTGKPVSELLKEFEQWPAVGVNCARFGTSGHRTRPAGLVIESYLHRTDSYEENRFIKSIVDPTRTIECLSAHAFSYTEGAAVDENFQPLEGPPFGITDAVSFSRLRVNHYYMKSEEEWHQKLPLQERIARERGIGVTLRQRIEQGPTPFQSLYNEQRDETITTYVPALREALEEVAGPTRPVTE